MAQNLNKTKRRISSINSTKKITKAMELVASVKLKRFKNVMLQNDKYTSEIVSLINILFNGINEKDKANFASYFKSSSINKTLYIVVTSNLGLCASYNNDIYKYIDKNINKDNSLIMPIGVKGDDYLKRNGYQTDERFVSLNEKINYSDVVQLGRFISNEFELGNYSSIKLIYTKYVNSIKFIPDMVQIYPINDLSNKTMLDTYSPIFDPDIGTLIKELLPLYVNSILYQRIVESQVSEQASRRNAMENANDNADELINQLTIEYNKARQSAITQEINEVVAGQIDK